MRDYGQIQSSYWTHPDVQSLSVHTKLVGAYLLTSPHTNAIGCFRVPMGYVSIDLGMGVETVSKGMQELESRGFLEHDPATDYVLIPNFLRWNPIANPNAAKARAKEFDAIPSTITIYPSLVASLLRHGKYWDEVFLNRIETLSKGFRMGCTKTVENLIERVPEDVRDNKPYQNIPEHFPPKGETEGFPQ